MLGHSIHSRIRFYSILLVGLPVVLSLIVSVFLIKSYVANTETDRLARNLSYQKVFVERWLDDLKGLAESLANSSEVKHRNLEETKALFQNVLATHQDISAVVLLGPDGKTLYDTSSPAGLDLSDREYFLEAKKGNPWVSDVLIGRTSGKPIMIVSHPVTSSSGVFMGLVFVPVRMTTLQSFLDRISAAESGETYLIDGNNVMMTASKYTQRLLAEGKVKNSAITELQIESRLLEAARKGETVKAAYPNYLNLSVFGAVTSLVNSRWLLITEIPETVVFRNFYTFIGLAAGAGIISLLLLTPLLMRFSRSITEPVNKLQVFAEEIAHGKYENECIQPDVRGAPVEVAQLYAAFCDMNAKILDTISELEETTHTDLLTCIPNRRYLMTEGERVLGICQRAQEPCCCFMLDIDHFKHVNDNYGHNVGDEVLYSVAQTLKDTLRKSDVPARFGGEEFAVVVPNADLEQARILGDRIRTAVEELSFSAGGAAFSVTISVGIADAGKYGDYGLTPLEDALARADQALYRAKAQGRNCVVCWEPEQLDHQNLL